jgi:hypothetical protein
MPYTYLIGWSCHALYYYGVRYAKNCNPNDLFVTYFTSSNVVKNKINELGMPDIIRVRKTFKNSYKAKIWESKVLRRIKAVSRIDFLNRNDKLAPPAITPEMLKDSLNICKGDDRSDMQRAAAQKHSAIMKGKPSKHRMPITVFGIKYESFTYAMKQLKLCYATMKFVRDNGTMGLSNIDELKAYIWAERSKKLSRRTIADKTKKNLSKALKGNKNRKGHTNTLEHNKKVSDALNGKTPQLVTCPRCSKAGGINVMNRWHFDNCSRLEHNNT